MHFSRNKIMRGGKLGTTVTVTKQHLAVKPHLTHPLLCSASILSRINDNLFRDVIIITGFYL